MSDEKFKKALYDALIPEYVAVMRDADDTVHEFSPEFEKSMKKLIKRRNKPYYKLINTVGKRAACIVVIILVASSVTVMSVEALRRAVADFFVDVYEKFSTIQSVDSVNFPETIENIYDITYDLSEYEVIFEERTEYKYWKIYQYGDITLTYSQYTKNKYNKDVNTENAEITTIDINGHEAVYFLDNHNYHHLILDNGYYIIELVSNIDKNEFIKIAESVKADENDIAPLTIEDIYDITYDLSEYEITYEEKATYHYFIEYTYNDIIIDYSQHTKEKFNIDTNTEDAEINTIEINGFNAIYFYDNHNYHHLIWDNNEYIIELMSNIDKNSFLEIAKSVQKRE